MKTNLSKKERLLRYRKQSRLPRYDIAVKRTNTGAQGFTYNPVETSLTQGVDISGDIASQKSNILPNAVQNIVSAATLPSTLTKAFSSMGLKELGKNSATPGTSTAANAAGNVATSAASDAAVNAAASAGKGAATSAPGLSGLTTAAGAANVAAALYGTYDMLNGIFGMEGNTRSSQDMIDTASKQTVYRNGVAYDKLGGVNSGLEGQYVKTQNTSDTIKNAISGAGAGMATAGAIGATAGSVVPGIGTAIGAGVGALIGGLGSLFGASKRRKKMRENLNKASLSIENTNRQNEAVAASQGLRNQFYQNHYGYGGYLNADRGFNPSYSTEKRLNGETRVVWTPEGKRIDEQGSWVGKGESLLDYTTGKASVVKQGKVGVDNQPSSAKEGDTITIAGNDINWNTGNTFAKEVAPYTKVIEEINKKEEAVQNSSASQKTKEINMLNLRRAKEPYLAAAKRLTDQQQMQHDLEGLYGQQMRYYNLPRYSNANKNVSGDGTENRNSFWDGVGQYAPYLINYMTSAKQYNDYKNAKPTAYNPYTPNTYAPAALNALSSLYYDPSTELNAARDTYRQQLYTNNNAGSLSAGQRAALNNVLGLGLMRNKVAALQNAQNKNTAYREAWAKAALESGNQEAARKQAGIGAYNEQLANAYAARLKGMETAQKSKANILEMFSKHLFDNDQYQKALLMQDKMRKLYDTNG